mgnify:CR=1 FL=1
MNKLLTYRFTILLFILLFSCSKDDTTLFYDQVQGKLFIRVDLIELNNKSINQVNPSEYAFVKNFNSETGHTVMYFLNNTETCTQFNAWVYMYITKQSSNAVEADVKHGKIYDLKDHQVKYEIIQREPMRITYNLANGTQITVEETSKDIFYEAKDDWLKKSRNTVDTTFSNCVNLNPD